MQESRKQVTAICYLQYLIVAGGRGAQGVTVTVEILKLTKTTNQWSYVAELPRPVCRASGCITLSNSYLYILGGHDFDESSLMHVEVNYAFKAFLPELLQSNRNKRLFKTIENVPTLQSAYSTYGNQLYAIGGSERESSARKAKSSKLVYEYDSQKDKWKEVNPLTEPRCYGFAVSIRDSSSTPQLMVVGGYTKKPNIGHTSSVEIGTMSK